MMSEGVHTLPQFSLMPFTGVGKKKKSQTLVAAIQIFVEI